MRTRMVKVLDVTLDVTAFSWKRPAQAASGVRYVDARSRDARAEILAALLKANAIPHDPWEEPLCVRYRWRVGVADARRWGEPCGARPDLDNLMKHVNDACNGRLWKDDAQIWAANATKRYGEKDLLRLTVYRLRTVRLRRKR